MSVMAVLSVNVLTANMLLSVLFVSGALAACPEDAALHITAPKEMEALSGSCLQIPCSFVPDDAVRTPFDSRRNITAVWLKSDTNFDANPGNVVFNSSKAGNIYPAEIIGNLNQTNCTTVFSKLNKSYTETYFFRIENDGYKASAECDPLQITVRDSPPSPTIQIAGDLKEKESVTVTCSAFTPCPHSPPQLTWNLQQDAPNLIEENTNQTFTTKIQKTITLSDKYDGYNISCSANYSVNEGKDVKTAEERKTLNVSYAPKNTSVSISPSGLLSAGIWVNLTCSSRANPPVSSFTWFKNSKDGLIKVFEGQVYSFNATEGAVYYCVATNGLGNQTSTEIHLIFEGEQQPVSFSTWGIVVGVIIVVICVVAALWWFKSKHPNAQQIQSQTVKEPAGATEKEDIHYGEIDFSKQRPKPPSASVQDSEQQPETLYAQVKVSQTSSSLTPTADEPESLYAQVKKK